MASKTAPKIKINPSLDMFFFINFKGTKTPNINSPHQIESFDINIVHFGGLIDVNDTFISLLLEFSDLSLSSLNQGLKNNKNKFLYQN